MRTTIPGICKWLAKIPSAKTTPLGCYCPYYKQMTYSQALASTSLAEITAYAKVLVWFYGVRNGLPKRVSLALLESLHKVPGKQP
jgi:hypothetical protein